MNQLLMIGILFLSLSLSTPLSHSKVRREPLRAQSLAQWPDQKEIRKAREFRLFWNRAKDGRVNLRKLNVLKKKLRKSSIFSPEFQWLDQLSQILRIKNRSQFLKSCSLYERFKQFHKRERILWSQCVRTLGKLTKKKSFPWPKSYLEKTLIHFLSLRDYAQVRALAQELRHKKSHFSMALTRVVEKRPHLLHRALTKYLIPTLEMTNSLQKISFFDQSQEDRVMWRARSSLVLLKKILEQPDHYKLANPIVRRIENLILSSNLEKRTPIWKSLMFTSKLLLNRNLYDESTRISRLALKHAQGREQKEKTFFRLLFNFWKREDYYHALREMRRLHLIEESAQFGSRLQFWIAYTLEKEGLIGLASKHYKYLIKDHPLSFYAITSSKRLQGLNFSRVQTHFVNIAKPSEEKVLPLELPKNYLTSLYRLKLWASVDSRDLMSIERRKLSSQTKILLQSFSGPEDKAKLAQNLTLIESGIYSRAGRHLASFSRIFSEVNRYGGTLDRSLAELLYPRPFLEMIQSHVKDFDPLIILSLIRQESAFDPTARSIVGARGLMQLMPKTARSISSISKDRKLNRPELNIRLGVEYFQQLYQNNDYNLMDTLMSYNAGESHVKRWRNLFFKDLPFLQKIETIPFDETKKYVKLIYRNIYFYKLLQGSKNDSPELNVLYDLDFLKRNKDLSSSENQLSLEQSSQESLSSKDL